MTDDDFDPEALAKVLDAPMEPNDSGEDTVRGYFLALLQGVLMEGEGFSGKRPFGNSGWEYALYRAIVKVGLIEGVEIDAFDKAYLTRDQREVADRLLIAAAGTLK